MDWTRNLEVGIPTIDEQHKELLRAFNDLQDSMRAGRGTDRVLPTLRFLGDYALKHFGAEETLMRLHRYPELEAHRVEHDTFRADFSKLLRETEATPHRIAKTMAVSRQLLDWLLAHIGRVDKRMGEYLVKQGAR